jgi:hypothetical protein
VRFAVNEPSIAETGFSPDFSGYPVIIILSWLSILIYHLGNEQ